MHRERLAQTLQNMLVTIWMKEKERMFVNSEIKNNYDFCENAQQSGVQVVSDVVIYCPLLYASNADSLLVVSDAKIWVNHALSELYDEIPLWVLSVFLILSFRGFLCLGSRVSVL